MTDFMSKPDLGEYSPNKFFDVGNSPFDIEDRMLYNVISGSRAYGLDTPASDVDIRGVVCPDLTWFFGLKNFEQVDNQKKDVCFYSLKKFFDLALKNNVHALEMLWMPERTVNYVHPVFQKVLDSKHLFMSKRLGYTCGGYAYQQVKLMFVKKANNSGRQALIEKFGHDTKMSSHALRILRMGREALTTGEMLVYRPDREELLTIKNGKYKLHEMAVLGTDSVGKEAVVDGMLKEEFDLFYKALHTSSLPDKPDEKKIEQLLIDIHKEYLNVVSPG